MQWNASPIDLTGYPDKCGALYGTELFRKSHLKTGGFDGYMAPSWTFSGMERLKWGDPASSKWDAAPTTAFIRIPHLLNHLPCIGEYPMILN